MLRYLGTYLPPIKALSSSLEHIQYYSFEYCALELQESKEAAQLQHESLKSQGTSNEGLDH